MAMTPFVGQAMPPAVAAAAGTIWGRLVVAAGVLVAGWVVTRLAVRYLARPMGRRFQRPSITRTVLRSIRVLGMVAALLVAAHVLGLRLGNVVLSVTVFSAVLGLVLAPIVGSIVSGLFVLADQPYEVGDLIEFAGQGTRGFVEDITLRYTKIFTLDNTFLVIPNSTMRDRDVVNYSAEDERTRRSMELLVTYEGDLEAARELMEAGARAVEEVIEGGPGIRIGSARYPAEPTCYVEEYADDGVLLNLRYWAKQPYKPLTVRSKVNEEVWSRIQDEPAVTVAYPHRHHVFDDTSGTASVVVDGRNGRGSGRNGGPQPSPNDGRQSDGDGGRQPGGDGSSQPGGDDPG